MPEKRIIVPLTLSVMLMLALVLALFVSPSLSAQASLAGSPFQISVDDARGYVTAENDAVKVVWHYKPIPSEYNNRGGGNIYELYDKRTDPDMQKNLVAVVNAGTGGTSPPKAGIGGLGATYLYERGYNVAISDNAGRARLNSLDQHVDASGNFVFQASYTVSSAAVPGEDSYRIDKIWTLQPDGRIRLQLSTQMLHTIEVSQPAYNFSFNRDFGWTQASAIRHQWNLSECGGVGSNGAENHHNSLYVLNNIDQQVDQDNSLLHTQAFSLYGQPQGSAVRVKMDNGGLGFEGGGLFALGARLWGTTASPTSEFSDYTVQAHGDTMRFYGWWGGDPPQTDRYQVVTAGTTWSDSLWIEMFPAATQPDIALDGGVSTATTTNSATINWNTNSAADTQMVLTKPDGTPVSQTVDPAWVTSHSVEIGNLESGTTYLYAVRSTNEAGNVDASGTFTTAGPASVNLNLALAGTGWASYSDYLSRQLTVSFNVTNSGASTAIAPQLMSIRATNGVSGNQPAGLTMADILPGATRVLTVKYTVPDGVGTFQTMPYVRAQDVSGTYHYFPGMPPQ